LLVQVVVVVLVMVVLEAVLVVVVGVEVLVQRPSKAAIAPASLLARG
jgi:hypothetical protein